jgi:hypothetical protein
MSFEGFLEDRKTGWRDMKGNSKQMVDAAAWEN